MENSKEIMRQELTAPELRAAVGGDLIDDAVCLVRGHKWIEIQRIFERDEYIFVQYHCERCGKYKYFRYVEANGQTTEIDGQEFGKYAIP